MLIVFKTRRARPCRRPMAAFALGLMALTAAGTASAQKAYISNQSSNTVSVIDAASNTVISTVPVGSAPTAFGQFIGPAPAPPPAAVPTLSEWAMILLGVLLAGAAVVVIQRRRFAT